MRSSNKLWPTLAATALLSGLAVAQTLGPPTGSGNAITALTGDCTASGPGSTAITCTKTNGTTLTGAATAPYVSPTSWTPADGSGASLTFTGVSANYTRIGNMVFAYAKLTYPSTVDGSNAVISGLPITSANQGYSQQCSVSFSSIATLNHMIPAQNGTTILLETSAGAAVTNAQMSTGLITFICIYPAT